MSEFHAEAPQAAASEGLAQSPYVSARAGFEHTTLRTKGEESTNEPPRLTSQVFVVENVAVTSFDAIGGHV